MLNRDALRYLNQSMLDLARPLRYTVKDEAPSTETALFSTPSLVVWSGASDNTIYQDAAVNYAFRAVHDKMHLETGLGFSVDHEIELGRIQASRMSSDFLAELIYCEIAGQALYYKQTGSFVPDQVAFTLKYLNKKFDHLR